MAPRNRAALSTQTPQHKQPSISSFFTKPPSRQHSIEQPTTTKDISEVVAPRDDLHKRRLSDTAISDNESLKRPRVADEATLEQLDTLPVVSDRTSKYLFTKARVADMDENQQRQRALLHEKFVKKLGGPDSLVNLRKRKQDDEVDEVDVLDEDDEDEVRPQSRLKKTARKDKYTPLERQVIDIKRKNADTLLVIEVGYKFRLFGEDARTAAKELSIVFIPGKFRFDEHPSEAHLDRFASASFPVHRLHVHVKRLVSAGHKVGVVRQLETAALKAAGANRNTAFERGLTNLYTKGTYIDDQEGLDGDITAAAPSTGHLLCLTETFPKGWGTDERVQIGFVAVQPATGDIIYDDFEDGWMRSDLETRLLHIAPCEFLIVGEITKTTEKLIEHLTASRSNVFGDKARVERIEKPKTMAAQAHSHLTKFYADKMKPEAGDTWLDKVHRLSENATICLSAMIKHLSNYKLEHVFDLTKYFQSFSARSHMLINGNTLSSLEIFQNQTDHTEYGSLFWAMNRTRTRFGQRLLRKWIARPMLDHAKLQERLDAVTELHEKGHTATVSRLQGLLGRIKGDLERSLIRIYYGKCTRPELLSVLQTLHLIAQEYAHFSSKEPDFTSTLIKESILMLPAISIDVLLYLERINADAAKSDDKYNFFLDGHETEDITNHKVGIIAVEHDLDAFKQVAAAKLKRSKVEYVTVAGIDYLIELDNATLNNVPASWIKISGTKKCSRYHTPEVMAYIRERDQHKESLANACDEAYTNLLAEIAGRYQSFRDCVQALAQLDCLLSMAEIAAQPGYSKPEYSDSGLCVKAGRHPMVEQMLLSTFVPNDIDLQTDGTRALLVTGPNMGGKSSYVRSIALIAIMAQCGSYVPADHVRIGLLDAVFTRMGAFDNMMKRESTFMVELSETADILKQATPRSLVILDELGRGTSTHDGIAIAEAVLHHMVTKLRSYTLFITHYQALTRMAERYNDELKNVHMKFAEANDQDITFLYEIGEGVAHRSYGLNVAKLAGLPRPLIDRAADRSKNMEEEEMRRRIVHLGKTMRDFSSADDHAMMEYLVTGIDQL